MPQESENNAPKSSSNQRSPNTVAFILKNERNGRHLNHPQKGQVEVVALYCNCGRSVFLDVNDLERTDVICSRCRSPFQWQQLSFADLNAA